MPWNVNLEEFTKYIFIFETPEQANTFMKTISDHFESGKTVSKFDTDIYYSMITLQPRVRNLSLTIQMIHDLNSRKAITNFYYDTLTFMRYGWNNIKPFRQKENKIITDYPKMLSRSSYYTFHTIYDFVDAFDLENVYFKEEDHE